MHVRLEPEQLCVFAFVCIFKNREKNSAFHKSKFFLFGYFIVLEANSIRNFDVDLLFCRLFNFCFVHSKWHH